MKRLRTMAAFAMLVGIFVLAAGVLVALGWALLWAVGNGVAAGAFGAFAATVAFVIIMSLARVIRHDPFVAEGILVGPADQPELVALVTQAAEAVGTRPPDEIRFVHDANASVVEDSRWLGFVGGQRVLYIGIPLFQTLTHHEMLFVLGHEMGHYSERHTALSGVTRRGLASLGDMVEGLGPRTVLGRVFGGYFAAYARVLLGNQRRQEFDADRWAAAVAGPEVGMTSLRKIVETAVTFEAFTRDYAYVGAGVGLAPQGLFSGYSEFLSDGQRTPVDIDALIAGEQQSWADSHPLTSRRIARLSEQSAGTRGADLSRADEPALALLRDPVSVANSVEDLLWNANSLTAVPWEVAVSQGARRRTEERAVHIMSAFDHIGSGSANLSEALYAVAHGKGPEVVQLLGGGRVPEDQVLPLLRDVLGTLVSAALVSTGHASYVLRWDRADTLVDEAGVELDVDSLVADLPGNSGAAEWLMGVLQSEGIPRHWNPALSGTREGPSGPEILSVMVAARRLVNYLVVYVTEAGLAVRTLSYRELHSIMPISPSKTPLQVLQHSLQFTGLFLLSDPATEMVAWDAVEHVTFHDSRSPRLLLKLRDGSSRSFKAIAVSGQPFEALARFNYGRMTLG